MANSRPTSSLDRPDRDRDKAVEIFVAAARIFSEKGFHATSINEVAEAVHLTKAGLYYYIKGKQDLLFRIMQFAMDTLEAEVVTVALREKELTERLRTIVARYTRLIIEGRNELSVLVNEIGSLDATQREEIVTRQRRYMRFIRETLDGLAGEDRLQAVDTTVAAYALSGMILWVSRWHRPEGRLGVDDLVDQITRIALAGVLAGEPTTQRAGKTPAPKKKAKA